MIQSIVAAHTLIQDTLRAQGSAKNILLGSDIEASIRDSFSTVLTSILVGNKNETTGCVYKYLVGYIKDYSIWHPRGYQGSSGLITRILEGPATVTGSLKRLRNTLTTDPELK